MKVILMYLFSTILIAQVDSTSSLKSSSKYSEIDSSYAKVSIGATFAFSSEFKDSDFYSDISLFFPKIWNNVGLFFGINQSTSIKIDSTYTGDIASEQIKNSKSKNITLFASVNYFLQNHIYMVGHAEVRKIDFSYDLQSLDSGTSLKKYKGRYYKYFYGVGPFLSISSIENKVNFNLRILLGHIHHKDPYRITGDKYIDSFAAYIPFEIRFLDSGIKLGGELRWETNTFYNDFIVFGAKEFSTKKILDFLSP